MVEAIRRSWMTVLFFVVLTLGAFICMTYLDSPLVLMERQIETQHKQIDIPLKCSSLSGTCPANYYPSNLLGQGEDLSQTAISSSCPNYFRWIHDDLLAWRETGITREMVMNASETANFRLVILDGKAYVETYRKSFQTRDTFTLWGILQLLRRYPGKLPDLDLMFNCDDQPLINKETLINGPPPLFRYCATDSTLNILFPDWSFWGWPEVHIKPWEALSNDLEQGNRRSRWTEREPHAYWKGNPKVAETRKNLLSCNVSDEHDWNARIYAQDWLREQNEGFKQSDLASQCIHRYKIYIEGNAWSVSQKYILACNSVTLLVKTHYYDFFSRGLIPLKHYWPINEHDKCRSIKHAVDWGNSHQQQAQAIGKAGSTFILDELKMDYVYDYMFHLLTEYAKLLKYKPTVPPEAVELCSESMACTEQGLVKKFMTDSLVKGPALSNPCTMPPPYDPASLHSFIQTKDNGIEQVEAWEKTYWQRPNKQM